MSFNLGSPPKDATLTFAAWSQRHLKVVERAIIEAWNQLLAKPNGKALATTAIEPDITIELQKQLVCLLNNGLVKGFSPAIFGAPIRGQELDDYSGKQKEKRPDLTIPRLSARPVSHHNALFYECKILGRGRTLDDYLKEGIMRFIDGRYAWCMPHAGMIAYVTSPHSTDPCQTLHECWTDTDKPGSCIPIRDVERDTATDPPIAISVHARMFQMPDGSEPGYIWLRHLWLDSGGS